MSSHHIVRDQQEPALIVEDISEFPIKSLNEMLGWSPTVVCLEKSIVQFSMYGLKVDHAIVEKKKLLTFEEILSHQYPFTLHKSEENSLKQAIYILKESAHPAINIITSKARLSEAMREVLAYPEIEFSIFTPQAKALLHRKNEYHKWVPKDTQIELESLNKEALFQVFGFTTDLYNGEIGQSRLLVAREDGKVKITCSQPPFLISEEL